MNSAMNCTNHYNLIIEAMKACEDFIFNEDNLATEDIPHNEAIPILEQGLYVIEETLNFLNENNTLDYLPPRTSKIYTEAINTLSEGLEKIKLEWEVQLVYRRATILFDENVLELSEYHSIQSNFTELPSTTETLNEYLTCRKLSIEQFNEALFALNT